MKVHHPDEPTEEANIPTYYNLTDCLWNCDNERWDGCWRMHNFTLANTPWFYRGEGNANLVLSLPREFPGLDRVMVLLETYVSFSYCNELLQDRFTLKANRVRDLFQGETTPKKLIAIRVKRQFLAKHCRDLNPETQEKVILRLQKLEYDVKITSTLLEELEQKLLRDVEFYRKVMVSFLGTSFFQPPILARISEKEVSQIDHNLFTIRPRYRLTKGIRCGLVTIHPDYTHLPPVLQTLSSNIYEESHLPTQSSATYCIEIKPKQGWIPLLDRKHPKCTFCMNQYLKIMKKRVVGISQYCPLDLFSGNTLRMKRAIRNLLMTPQNNLKIFKNGNLIFSEDFNRSYVEVLKDFFMIGSKDEVNIDKLIDRWCALVVSGLCMRLPNITSFKNTVSDCTTDEIVPSNQYSPATYNGLTSLYGQIKPCDWSSQPLPNNSILQRILKVQQLQNTNFAAVCSLYRERCATEGDYSYIESLLESDGHVDIIQRYLVATTAKDCSIFLALKSASKGDLPYKTHFIKDCEGVEYRLNIGISDIDPKPLSCIGKHIKRDKEVLDAVLQFMHHTTPA